jgi:TPR repeat protein
MFCCACGKESADEFNFCPHCGKAFAPKPSVIESAPSPSPEVHSVTDTQTDESRPARNGAPEAGIRIGTWVFGAFSGISLLVSVVKGLVPLYLLEAAGWAGAAWYWQAKKTHSEFAKAVVVVIAILVGIGEVVHIVSQAGESNTTASTNPYAVSRSSENIFDRPSSSAPDYSAAGSVDRTHGSVVAGTSSASDLAEIEQKAISLYKKKQYADARPLFDQACDGGEMNACNYLGYLCAKGLGGVHDTKKARDVYQRACDQGTLSSCASLGSLYQDAGNSEEARKYFNKACQGGVDEACGLLRGVE